MNIYVLMKKTFDTEEKIQISDGKIETDGAEFIINPYDEYAIEEAIKVRDEHGGEVTVVTIGDEESESQLRTALAMEQTKLFLLIQKMMLKRATKLQLQKFWKLTSKTKKLI